MTNPEDDFEKALLAYGKMSQDFQMRLASLGQLQESMAAVGVAHQRAVQAARAEAFREARLQFMDLLEIRWKERVKAGFFLGLAEEYDAWLEKRASEAQEESGR